MVYLNAYQPDLAYIHHTGFTGFVRQAAPGLLRTLRQHGIRSGLVVDAGCGSGVWARELTGRGYSVLGIDISPAMIRLARREAPPAKFQVGSFLSAKLPSCDAVTAIGECVNYAFDPQSGKRGLARLFRRVYEALHPGGVFLFDVVEPGIAGAGGVAQRFREGPGWTVLVELHEDTRRRLLTRRIVTFRQVGKLYRRSDEIHKQHLYPRAELVAQLAAAGFKVKAMNGYGRFRLPPAHSAFLARRPA